MKDNCKLALPEDIVKKTMQEYRIVIRSLFDTQSAEIVHNASLSHAAVILEEMVQRAKSTFYAIARNLNRTAWNSEVVQALVSAKRRGVEIELLVTDTDIGNFAHLKEWDETVRACIKMVSAGVRAGKLPNFAVMDRKALRYEVDQAQATAAFCANNPKYALPAFEWFQMLKEGAEPLPSIP